MPTLNSPSTSRPQHQSTPADLTSWMFLETTSFCLSSLLQLPPHFRPHHLQCGRSSPTCFSCFLCRWFLRTSARKALPHHRATEPGPLLKALQCPTPDPRPLQLHTHQSSSFKNRRQHGQDPVQFSQDLLSWDLHTDPSVKLPGVTLTWNRSGAVQTPPSPGLKPPPAPALAAHQSLHRRTGLTLVLPTHGLVLLPIPFPSAWNVPPS